MELRINLNDDATGTLIAYFENGNNDQNCAISLSQATNHYELTSVVDMSTNQAVNSGCGFSVTVS